jgi:hypothetical protein
MSAIDHAINEHLETAAQRIERQLTPLCVCEVHGGHDVQRAVRRAAQIVRDLKVVEGE